MSKNTTASKQAQNVVYVAKRPSIVEHQVKNVADNRYVATNVTNVTSAEKKRADVKVVLDSFLNVFEVEAQNATEAALILQKALRLSLTTKSATPVTQTKETPAEARAKAETGDSKPADPKEQSGDNKPAKEEEKPVMSFKYFCEDTAIDCFPMTPENAKIVDLSLKFFQSYTLLLDSTKQLTEADEAVLNVKSAEFKASESLVNRSSLRLLIIEADEKNKPVAAFLCKPVYISPYAFSCIVEAHYVAQKKKSMYRECVNLEESEMTVYDAFQFNPQRTTFTTFETLPTKNKAAFMFVNVKVKARK